MTDPTPNAEPYAVDDRVRVRLADEAAESPYEGTSCRVVHVFTPEPDDETGDDADTRREMDDAAYRLEDESSGEVLPVVFRHRDVVPEPDDS